jgi:hypothetical protein
LHQIFDIDKNIGNALYKIYFSKHVKGGAYRALARKPEGRPLGRPRRRWEVNIKMDLREIGRGA